ncbi:MAG: VRR-NUC domain-containing protein [Chloroflexi bacterium]|nr:MAG: VRR-NUC domain-containing protein [Chloroflexota bacterium]
MTERELQAAVLQLAAHHGWRTIHHFDSRRTSPGWPDLIFVRGDRMIAWELKSEKGRLTKAQRDWLNALSQVRYVDVAVVRPAPTLDALEVWLR